MAITTIKLNTGETLDILKEDNIFSVSVQASTASTVDVTGNAKIVTTLNGVRQIVTPSTLTLTAGEGFTVVAPNAINLIDQLSIVATGSVNVLLQT